MPLPVRHTLTLIRELETDGHSPLKFLCDDFAIYYCKYRSGRSLNPNEIDCLFYEILCNTLLKTLHIPTPELAWVTVSEGSYDRRQLNYHKKFCKPGTTYLGSKEVAQADLVHTITKLSSRREFKVITNPMDLFKIAYFDLWVNNTDRGRSDNYNLLLQAKSTGSTFCAFDHAFCFGGLDMLRIFNALNPVSTKDKLISSAYFKEFLQYLNTDSCKEIVDNFLPLHTDEIRQHVSNAYQMCHPTWAVPEQLVERAVSYLQDEVRLDQIKQIMLLAINKK